MEADLDNNDYRAKYLIDTSALYPLIRRLKLKIIDILEELAVLDLTFYEIGNTIWKEYRRGLITNPYRTMEMFSKILEHVEKIEIKPECLTEILEIALKYNLTFYDASYLYASRKHELTLITEDKDLLQTTNKSIRVQQLLSKLGIEQ